MEEQLFLTTLDLFNNLSDQELVDLFQSTDIEEFCYMLTLDLADIEVNSNKLPEA